MPRIMFVETKSGSISSRIHFDCFSKSGLLCQSMEAPRFVATSRASPLKTRPHILRQVRSLGFKLGRVPSRKLPLLRLSIEIGVTSPQVLVEASGMMGVVPPGARNYRGIRSYAGVTIQSNDTLPLSEFSQTRAKKLFVARDLTAWQRADDEYSGSFACTSCRTSTIPSESCPFLLWFVKTHRHPHVAGNFTAWEHAYAKYSGAIAMYLWGTPTISFGSRPSF